MAVPSSSPLPQDLTRSNAAGRQPLG